MEKFYRTISIVLIIFLAIITASAGVFCFTQKLWIKSVKAQLSDTQKMIEGGNFAKAKAGLALSGIFPSDKQNRDKLYEQKAIIAAHSGEIDLSRKYFEEAGGDLSETGKYYDYLVEEIKEIKEIKETGETEETKEIEKLRNLEISEIELRIKNRELRNSLDKILVKYNGLSEYQWDSAYRELLLSQILVEIGEPRMAEYALNQAIKKDPDYRDAYVLLLQIKSELGEDVRFEEKKIKEVDPDYLF